MGRPDGPGALESLPCMVYEAICFSGGMKTWIYARVSSPKISSRTWKSFGRDRHTYGPEKLHTLRFPLYSRRTQVDELGLWLL